MAPVLASAQVLRALVAAAALSLGGCVSTPAERSPASHALVRQLTEAFNQHDVAAMLAMCTDDVRWMSVSGSSLGVEAEGAAALGKAMEAYFSALPSARSVLLSVDGDGAFLSTVEQAQWQSNGQKKHQCARAVYQLAAQRIANVWYFPAYECERVVDSGAR